MVLLKPDEKFIMGKEGYLILTNKRLIHEHTEGLISKKTSTIFSVPLDKVNNVKVEGLISKKLIIEVAVGQGQGYPERIERHEFSGGDSNAWEAAIKSAVQQYEG